MRTVWKGGVAALLLSTGCGGVPEARDLYGTMWANLDAGEWRVLSFEETRPELPEWTDVYGIHQYVDGEAPVEIQYGRYQITEETLFTSVHWNADGTPGGTYANAILDYSRNAMELSSETASEGSRVFERVTSLP
ncbi:MAG: hypothetical protein H6737_06100 [Alphaproteobacteria bacterium]|nr:hypothetical protein [Myxococcales bacterium]MCB9674669.1 hypothetical protein [Alphaproteobacteria bacterium]